MQGFQWFLKSIGIDLSPDGIREMFSKVTADDIKRVVGELGLNPDEIIAMPKIVAVKLQEFEQRQIRILQLLEAMNNDRHWFDVERAYPTVFLPGTNQGSTNGAGGSGDGSNGINNG